MNPHDEHFPGIEDQHLDRLVDGELSEAERRDLLIRLEQHPDPCVWRRCALAFLEAQSWKQDFGCLCRSVAGRAHPALPATVADRAAPASVALPATRRSQVRYYLGTFLAMAASFLVALALGSTARDWWQQAAQGPASAPPVDLVSTLQTPTEPGPADNGGVQAEPHDGWQMVTLDVPEGAKGATRSIQLPAIQRDKLDESWLREVPAAVPSEVLDALERNGYQVREHRQLVPVPMKDGRRLVVPVDGVEVHYVGNPEY